MADVSFKLTADAKQVLQTDQELIASQKKVEAQYAATAGAAERSQQRQQTAAKRTVEAYDLAVPKSSPAVRAVAASAAVSRAAVYSVVPLAASGPAAGTPGVAAYAGSPLRLARTEQEQVQRFLQAQAIRSQRNFAAFQALRSGSIGAWSSVSAVDRRIATEKAFAAGDAMMGAATVGFAARGGAMGFDDDPLLASSRARVARRVQDLPELRGKVSPQELETMAGVDAARRRRAAENRQKILTGTVAIGAGVGALANQVDQELSRYADVIVDTERMLAPLYGVGGNAARRGQVRRDVVSLAIGSGAGLERVAEMRARMESAFEDMPIAAKREAEQAALKYGRIGVQDMTATAMALGSAYQAFGKDLGGGQPAMRVLANQMAVAQDVGAFDPDEFAPYQAMILQAARGAGYSSADAYALSALASKSGMRPESWATAVRNIFLQLLEKMPNRTRDIVTDAKSLGTLGADELLDRFGKDAFVVAKMAADNPQLLADFTRRIGSQTAGGDVLGGKLAASFSDPMAATANAAAIAKQIQANVPNLQLEDPELQGLATEHELRKAGAMLRAPPGLQWTAPYRAGLGSIASWAYRKVGLNYEDLWSGGPLDSDFTVGVNNAIAYAEAAGNMQMADRLRIGYGRQAGNYYTGADGKRVYTGADDLATFEQLRKMGFTGLTGGEFTQYLQVSAASPIAGRSYLNRVGVNRPKPSSLAEAEQKYLEAGLAENELFRSAHADARVSEDEMGQLRDARAMTQEAYANLQAVRNGDVPAATGATAGAAAVPATPDGKKMDAAARSLRTAADILSDLAARPTPAPGRNRPR